jgi:anti-sigma B factor antagonist
MRYRLTDEGGALVIAFEGDIDLECSAEVRVLLLDCVSRERIVVVDMSGVAGIDSSGVATFLEAYQIARKQGGTFVLAAVGEAVTRVLKLARLDGVLTLADSVGEALRGRD